MEEEDEKQQQKEGDEKKEWKKTIYDMQLAVKRHAHLFAQVFMSSIYVFILIK